MSDPGFVPFVWTWDVAQAQTTPSLHATMADWLEAGWTGGDRALLLQAFRGAGKSSIVGLFVAWLLRRDPSLRILVLAADQALAIKMVRNVRRIVERHPALRPLRPRPSEEWAADRFTVARPRALRDPSVLARGIGANVTGSRADVAICDDVEVPNTCDTPEKRAELRRRLAEIDYVLVPGGLQLFIGTPHTYDTIYAEASSAEAEAERPFLDGFTRLTLPLENADGSSAWPDRYPPERIAALRRRSGPSKFASQMMLRPANPAEGRLDPGLLRSYAEALVYGEGNHEAVLSLDGRRMVSAACWWDPAFGAPDAGDSSVIAAVFFDAAGNVFLHRVAYLTHDPARLAEADAATQLCRAATAFARRLHLPSITLEINGLGRFLPGLLRREINAAGVPCAVCEVTTRRPKELRILEAFDAPLAAGVLHAHESVLAGPFLREMRDWRPDAPGCRDDGLDAVAGCLASEPVRLPRLPSAGRARPSTSTSDPQPTPEDPRAMTWTFDPIWWISFVEMPVLSGMFLLLWRTRRELQDSLETAERRLDAADGRGREALSAFKVEVATSYASIPALREQESRLTAHLVRIEKKLDGLGFGQGGSARA